MAKIELHPITKELLTAIDGAFAVSPYASTVMINASEAEDDSIHLREDEFGTDIIKIENDYVWLSVVVYRQVKLVCIHGFMKHVPGTPINRPQRFEGGISLDFSKPEMKADGNMFVDVFARMMKQYNSIASLMKEEIVY